jgi:hypothetical protein
MDYEMGNNQQQDFAGSHEMGNNQQQDFAGPQEMDLSSKSSASQPEIGVYSFGTHGVYITDPDGVSLPTFTLPPHIRVINITATAFGFLNYAFDFGGSDASDDATLAIVTKTSGNPEARAEKVTNNVDVDYVNKHIREEVIPLLNSSGDLDGASRRIESIIQSKIAENIGIKTELITKLSEKQKNNRMGFTGDDDYDLAYAKAFVVASQPLLTPGANIKLCNPGDNVADMTFYCSKGEGSNFALVTENWTISDLQEPFLESPNYFNEVHGSRRQGNETRAIRLSQFLKYLDRGPHNPFTVINVIQTCRQVAVPIPKQRIRYQIPQVISGRDIPGDEVTVTLHERQGGRSVERSVDGVISGKDGSNYSVFFKNIGRSKTVSPNDITPVDFEKGLDQVTYDPVNGARALVRLKKKLDESNVKYGGRSNTKKRRRRVNTKKRRRRANTKKRNK